MTTIIILNALSSLTATVGLGGYFARERRRARREAEVELVYVGADEPGPRER